MLKVDNGNNERGLGDGGCVHGTPTVSHKLNGLSHKRKSMATPRGLCNPFKRI